MWLKTLSIENFRSIKKFSIEFNQRSNVIVGPNAIGKTTLLEAIRLAKATLAPRTQFETQQAFASLGAFSPHNPMNLNFDSLLRDPHHDLVIDAVFGLSATELFLLDAHTPLFANALVRANFAGSAQGPLAVVQYLSSLEGGVALRAAMEQIKSALTNIKESTILKLKLTINPRLNSITGADPIHHVIFATLENQLPAHQALFSYFPADRALPTGEVNIQIGGQDIANQLETHNSQPQTKFHRLKQTIINNFLLNDASSIKLKEDFKNIFSQVLKDRELVGLVINHLGLVSIKIKELVDGRIFDIDGMSSGEKGLILTFLLISHAVGRDGLILLDEPELHLNPAVCKTILPFLIHNYLIPNNLQAIICSHSPEILSCAFEHEDCKLLHIQSPTIISDIFIKDKQEVFDALKRLGTSASDVLFYEGSIFVEGPDDVEILQTGFDKLLNKYNIKKLGGRNRIEEEIRTIQSGEKNGEVRTIFIFDLDNAPTDLQNTKATTILQWKRRCIENYLIDDVIIYDLFKDEQIAKKKIDSRGEVQEIFKGIALTQLQESVAKEIYESKNFENPGIRAKEIKGKTIDEMADLLFDRLEDIKKQVSELQRESWKQEFQKNCAALKKTRTDEWETDWKIKCDGKRFFQDLQTEYGIKIKPLDFKKKIIERMKQEESEGWVLMERLLREALKTT